MTTPSIRRRALVVCGRAGLAVIAVTAVGGCVDPRARGEILAPPEVIESAQRFRREYVLAPGDTIEVMVRGAPEVSRPCIIRPDGYITLPILHDVKAQGLTVSELRAVLAEQLATRLNSPDVTVIALEVRQPMVYVLGEVGVPQPVPLRNASTAAQAISMCGGLTDDASPRDVAVIRLTPDGYLRAYTLSSDIQGQPIPYMLLNSILLEPEDLIFAPESTRSQFVSAVNDYLNTSLGGINQILTPYFQFKLIEVVEDNN